MLNLKKGLALVLAAATALTFAPVANLGTAVQAEAAQGIFNRQSIDLVSETPNVIPYGSQYNGNNLDVISVHATNPYFKSIAFTWQNNETATGSASSQTTQKTTDDQSAEAQIGSVNGLKVVPKKTYATLSTVLVFSINGKESERINVTISPKSQEADWTKTHATRKDAAGNNNLTAFVNGDAGFAVRGATAPDGTTFEITDITSEDSNVVKVEADEDNSTKSSSFVEGTDPAPTSNVKVVPVNPGTTNVRVTYKWTRPNDDNTEDGGVGAPFADTRKPNGTDSRVVSVTVTSKTSIFKINDTEVSNTSSYVGTATIPVSIQTVEITPDKAASLTATLKNATADEKIYFYSVGNGDWDTTLKDPTIDTSDKTTVNNVVNAGNVTVADPKETKANDGTITSTTTVTGLAAAFDTDKNRSDSDETAYYVLVTNYKLNAVNSTAKTMSKAADPNTKSGKEKAALVKVLARKNARQFASVTATVDGKTYDKVQSDYAPTTSSGEVTYQDTVKRLDKKEALVLSTVDKKSVNYSVIALPATAANLSVTSNNTGLVSVDTDKKTINVVGTSVNGDTTVEVTFKVTGDSHYYGTASFVLPVTVTNKKVNTSITAPATLDFTNADKDVAKAIGATASDGLKLTYEWVGEKKDDAKAISNTDFTLDSDKGTLTYLGNTSGSAILRVSAKDTDTAVAPAPKYIDVTFDNGLADSALDVDKKALNLKVGDTATINVTGIASTGASIVSSDTSIASVTPATATSGSSVITVTAVKKGTAVITVTDPKTATVSRGTASITVNVEPNYTDPAKASGLKITNKKGANVTVTWTKDSTNPNVRYYIQKKVNKTNKWTTSQKTSGKSVGSAKATLSVKKGYYIHVRVKAYYYDGNGEKHVGAYSAWKTFKSDKK